MSPKRVSGKTYFVHLLVLLILLWFLFCSFTCASDLALVSHIISHHVHSYLLVLVANVALSLFNAQLIASNVTAVGPRG